MSRTRHRPRVAAFLLVLSFAVLSGCMKVDAQLAINEDDTVSGVIILAVDKRLAPLTGKTEDQLVASIGVDGDEIAAGAVTEPYSDAGFVGRRIVFRNTPLKDFHGTGQVSVTLAHDGDSYLLNGVVDLRTVNLADAAVQRFAELFAFSIAVTFPGKVVDHNGVLAGRTVTWTPKAGESLPLHARAEEPGVAWWPWALGAGVFFGVLAVAALVWVLSRRSRRTEPAAVEPALVETRHDML